MPVALWAAAAAAVAAARTGVADSPSAATRAAAIRAAFGYDALPTKPAPDFVTPLRVNATKFPGGQNEGIGPNTTVLTWILTEGGVTLNATVFWSLNTTGTAVADYPVAIEPNPAQSSGQTPGDGDTGLQQLPRRRTDTLVLYHNGHEAHWLGKHVNDPLCVRAVNGTAHAASMSDYEKAQCWINYDTVLGWVNELGYDAMELNMPIRGPNNNGSLGTQSHSWFEKLETRGHYPLRFFVEPVFLAVNYALGTLGYKRVALAGLSGGGWTTTVAAALDPRIGLSFPIAGSLPFSMRDEHPGDPYHDLGDFEQSRDRPVYNVCNYTCMYALAALEKGRQQLQILHEQDPCCFPAGRPNGHNEIRAYNRAVQAEVEGWMCTAVTLGNVHEVNLRDKTLVAWALDQFDAGTLDLASTCATAPFNVLNKG